MPVYVYLPKLFTYTIVGVTVNPCPHTSGINGGKETQNTSKTTPLLLTYMHAHKHRHTQTYSADGSMSGIGALPLDTDLMSVFRLE